MISYSDHFYSNLIVHLEIKYEHYKINHTSMNYELLIPNLFENIIHDSCHAFKIHRKESGNLNAWVTKINCLGMTKDEFELWVQLDVMV